MFILALKWMMVLGIISTVVFALSSARFRAVTVKTIKPYGWQVLIITILFLAVLTLSQQGT